VPLVARVVKIRSPRIPEWLMVRDISDSRAVAGNAIGDRRSGVIQVLGFNEYIADAKETFFELGVVNVACKVLKLYGEIRVLHLSGKRIFEASLKRDRTIDIQFRAGKECRCKEWESLDMIPVRVADQEVDSMRTLPAQHIQSEHSDTCTAIKHKGGAVIGP